MRGQGCGRGRTRPCRSRRGSPSRARTSRRRPGRRQDNWRGCRRSRSPTGQQRSGLLADCCAARPPNSAMSSSSPPAISHSSHCSARRSSSASAIRAATGISYWTLVTSQRFCSWVTVSGTPYVSVPSDTIRLETRPARLATGDRQRLTLGCASGRSAERSAGWPPAARSGLGRQLGSGSLSPDRRCKAGTGRRTPEQPGLPPAGPPSSDPRRPPRTHRDPASSARRCRRHARRWRDAGAGRSGRRGRSRRGRRRARVHTSPVLVRVGAAGGQRNHGGEREDTHDQL